MTTKMTTYDLLRKLKKDDTLRFGQWLWNLLDDSFEHRVIADYDFGEANMAIADKLWNIQDDELIELIKKEEWVKVYWTRDECCPVLVVEKKEDAWGEIEIPADLKSRFLKVRDDFWKVQFELEDYLDNKKEGDNAN